MTEGNERAPAPDDDFYYTGANTAKAERYLGEMSKQPEPFFLYVAHTAPHWPMHALEREIAKYKDTYKSGWDVLRDRRLRRMMNLGIADRSWAMTPRESGIPEWKDAPNQEWEARRMAVYGAMIDRLDQGIGRLMRKVRSLGKEHETLFLFLSDNGACAENFQPEWYDISEQDAERQTDTRRQRSQSDGWRGGLVAQLRTCLGERKQYAIPLIQTLRVRGRDRDAADRILAGVIKANTIMREPGHVIDLMPTCLDAAQAKAIPVEGKSLLPLFKTGKRSGHDAIFWEHEGNRAVRQGDWKLVASHGKPWELYNLGQDRTELNNLQPKEGARASQMAKIWDEWARRSHVLPWNQVRAKRKG